MIKKIIAAIMVIAALVFFGYHTLHYGVVISQRDATALYQWQLNR